MGETQWPHTLHISLNQKKQYNPVSQTEGSDLLVTAIIQILDVPIPKLDILVLMASSQHLVFVG
jgi:hypothetical protein